MARRRISRKSMKALHAKAHKSRKARAKDVHVGHKSGTHVRTVNAPKSW